MVMSLSSSLSPRVLCVTLRTGSIGHAVLDGYGVPDGAFFTRRIDHLASRRRMNALLELLLDSYRRYHPHHVVLGLTGRHCPGRVALAKQLADRLRRSGIVARVKHLHDAASLLVARVGHSMADALVTQLATHFVPDVTPAVSRKHPHAWYWRPAWYALAIALLVLVDRHPRVAAALARPGAYLITAFGQALAAAEKRLTPAL